MWTSLLLLASPLLELASAGDFGSIAYSNHFGLLGQNATYDYVVVGSGPGGLSIAYRLAEANFSVGLVEAGGFYEMQGGNRTITPGYYGPNLGNAGTDWNFQTETQPQLLNAKFAYDRGRTLGGSSALNAMLYQRATRGSMDKWASTVNDSSYEWDSFLPFYQRSANYTPPNASLRFANASVPAPSAKAYIKSGGPLHVTHANWASPFSSWGQKGLAEIGMPAIRDFSSGNLIGSQYCPLTINPEDQTRASSEATFLRAYLANSKSNLQVYTQTVAQKVLFDTRKNAVGVAVQTYSTKYYLKATKEVILSAGAFQSPQLLMVSGIGPKAELKKQNIATLVDLPGVGRNMQDHVLFGVFNEVNVSTPAAFNVPSLAQHWEKLYQAKPPTGQLTSQSADYLGWEKLPDKYRKNLSPAAKAALAKYPADWPELEYVVGSFPISPQLSDKKNYGFMEVALIAPQSRGNITLASSSMNDAPLINVGWLTNPIDVEMAIASVRRARDFFAAKSMKPVLIGGEAYPGLNVTTDAQLDHFIRSAVHTVYHASCTCAMGLRKDPMAVLDSRARVYGVQRLRVVDASSFPFLVPGHPQSTIYALGEKIADDIIKGQ